MKLCPTCKSDMDKSMFAKSASTRDGLNWQCRSCHKARMKKQREGYAEHVAELPIERKCSTCKIVKPAKEFNRSKVTHDGLCNVCMACTKVYKKVRSEKNKLKNACRTEFHDQRCSSCKRVLPPSSYSKSMDRTSGLKPVCRECDARIAAEWRRNNQAKVLFNGARARAAECGIKFTIKIEDVYVPALCPVLKFPIEVGGERYNSPSLDRIDNSKGYEPGNVVVVSLRANRLKSDATLEELMLMVDFYSNINF